MIYVCADDYGLCDTADAHIEECIKNGALNKISTFVNYDRNIFERSGIYKNVHISLHINLVEGKAVSEPGKLKVIADEKGIFRYSFTGLLKKSVTHRKQFEEDVYEEIRAQIRQFKKLCGKETVVSADGHQHTHMIPSVMRMLIKAFRDENTKIGYLRIPAEPLTPFLLTPSLYHTYRPVNLIKQWLLIFFGLINGKRLRKADIDTAYFFGVLFSGNMDKKRVEKILPKYIRKAEKNNKDIEVLFHPGYLSGENDLSDKEGISFGEFYFSDGRKIEYDTLKNIKI